MRRSTLNGRRRKKMRRTNEINRNQLCNLDYEI